MRRFRPWIGWIAPSIVALAACQSILGIEDTTQADGSGGTATGGSAGTGGGGAGGTGATGGSGGVGGSAGATGGSAGAGATGGSAGAGATGGSAGAAGGGGLPDASTGGTDGGDASVDACPATPDFSVGSLADASVIRGKSVLVPVTVQLGACFSTAIDVSLQAATGLSSPGAQIPAGQTQTQLTINATAGAPVGLQTVTLNLTGASQTHPANLKLLVRDEAGELDESFTAYSYGSGTVAALATETDNDIIVAINPNSSNAGWSIKRLKSDGPSDSTFNAASLPSNGGIRDVAVAGNGQIVAVGDVSGGIAVVRLSTTGAGDVLMGTNGIYNVPTPNFPSTAFATALALQPDNKPVFAGNVQASDGIVARVDPSGSTTPVPPGKVDVQGYFTGAPMRALALSTNRFVVGGIKNGHVYLAAASSSSGTLDTTFGTSGSTTYSPSGFESVQDGVITTSGIYLVGSIQGGSDVYPTLFRFGLDGKSPAHTTAPNGQAYNIMFRSCAAQADGKIVAVGSGGTSASGYRVFVTRFNADGTIDATFAPAATPKGTKVFQVGGNTTGGAIAVAPDGRIIVGVTSPSGATVVRLWN